MRTTTRRRGQPSIQHVRQPQGFPNGGWGGKFRGPLLMAEKPNIKGLLLATWGVGGVLLLLGQAIWRLGARALEAMTQPLSTMQIAALVAWSLFSLYGEGYRAFQLRFSPRVVARALVLARSATAFQALLAPAFCMSLFHATRRGQAVAWSTVVMVICLVLVVSRLPQPWRGIIDGGVVLALAWGAAAIVVFFFRAVASGTPPEVDPALPPASTPAH